jgi:hypothetical protein
MGKVHHTSVIMCLIFLFHLLALAAAVDAQSNDSTTVNTVVIVETTSLDQDGAARGDNTPAAMAWLGFAFYWVCILSLIILFYQWYTQPEERVVRPRKEASRVGLRL